MEKPTLIDLFCGAGGLSHGFEQAGFKIVAGVDLDRDSLITFAANHPRARTLHADLSDASPSGLAEGMGVSPGQVDCLAGGPPCQGFSRNRAFRHRDGIFVDDPRNHLYWHFFEYVGYLRPKIVVMENVPEILIKGNGYFHDAVFKRFRDLGYEAQAKVLNAAEYGAPQRRRRAFFLAGRDGQQVAFPSPTTRPGRRAGRRTPTSSDYIKDGADKGNGLTVPLFDLLPPGPSVWDAISDLHGSYATTLAGECRYATPPRTGYQQDRRGAALSVRNHFPWPLTERQLRRIRLLGQGEGVLHLPEELRTADAYGSAYRRLQAESQALTITTWMFHPGSGMFTHPLEDRVITIREAARLQSFQDNFVFHGRYHAQCRQVGNSVAPLVARHIAESLLSELGHTSVQSSFAAFATP